MNEILLSGLFGALLATVLNAVFQRWLEVLRLRADTTLCVIAWIDGIYIRLINLLSQKKGAYTGGKVPLSEDEYKLNSRQIRDHFYSSEVEARITLVFGERDDLARLKQLKNELYQAASELWAAEANTWSAVEPRVLTRFANTIDPLRADLERGLLDQSSLSLLVRAVISRRLKDFNAPL